MFVLLVEKSPFFFTLFFLGGHPRAASFKEKHSFGAFCRAVFSAFCSERADLCDGRAEYGQCCGLNAQGILGGGHGGGR
jgi:hypothetical protein